MPESEELQDKKLELKYWQECDPSELRTRMITKLEEEIKELQ